MSQPYITCPSCGRIVGLPAPTCPACGHALPSGYAAPYQQVYAPYPPASPALQEASGKKVAAGLCGILLGTLGIHKFILGQTNAGLIMLLVSVLSCGILAPVMHLFGLIEGIIYLTKSDSEFYQTYMVEGKAWF